MSLLLKKLLKKFLTPQQISIMRRLVRIINLPRLIMIGLFMKKYYIKILYIYNLNIFNKATPYLDTIEMALVYQYEVYEFAKQIIERDNLKSLLDIERGEQNPASRQDILY